ncbi:unnamed protein product [Malus baccata var. baccata]
MYVEGISVYANINTMIGNNSFPEASITHIIWKTLLKINDYVDKLQKTYTASRAEGKLHGHLEKDKNSGKLQYDYSTNSYSCLHL